MCLRTPQPVLMSLRHICILNEAHTFKVYETIFRDRHMINHLLTATVTIVRCP